MIDENVLKPSIRIALGLATMAAAVALGLAVLLQPGESMRHFATVSIFAWVVTMGLAMSWPIGIHIGVAAEAGRLARAQMQADIARHEKTAAEFRHEAEMIGRGVVTPADTPAVIIDHVAHYDDQWRAYWLECLVYSEAKGGVSFQKLREFFGGDVAIWREAFAHPFAHAGILNPVQPRVETTYAPGWNVDKARWSIEAGRGPIPPAWPPPPPFSGAAGSQVDNPNSKKQAQNSVFAAETGEQ